MTKLSGFFIVLNHGLYLQNWTLVDLSFYWAAHSTATCQHFPSSCWYIPWRIHLFPLVFEEIISGGPLQLSVKENNISVTLWLWRQFWGNSLNEKKHQNELRVYLSKIVRKVILFKIDLKQLFIEYVILHFDSRILVVTTKVTIILRSNTLEKKH